MLARQEDGAYTTYVFLNLDEKHKYIMCTRMPNWHGEEPVLLQDGFLEYKFVEAGTKYWCATDSTYKMYQYTDFYFLDFVPITHVLHNGIVVTKDQMILS
jgi:hypothetical protein